MIRLDCHTESMILNGSKRSTNESSTRFTARRIRHTSSSLSSYELGTNHGVIRLNTSHRVEFSRCIFVILNNRVYVDKTSIFPIQFTFRIEFFDGLLTQNISSGMHLSSLSPRLFITGKLAA